MVVAQFCVSERSELNAHLKLHALSCQNNVNNENCKTKSLKLFDSVLNGNCPAHFVFESCNLELFCTFSFQQLYRLVNKILLGYAWHWQ